MVQREGARARPTQPHTRAEPPTERLAAARPAHCAHTAQARRAGTHARAYTRPGPGAPGRGGAPPCPPRPARERRNRISRAARGTRLTFVQVIAGLRSESVRL